MSAPSPGVAAVSVAVGVGLGWVLFGSRFSFDRAFRLPILGMERDGCRAYLLALGILWVAVAAAVSVSPSPAAAILPVGPVAAMLAGFASGVAMGIVRGCPLSLAFGTGRLSAAAAAGFLGWLAGLALGFAGPLAPLVERIRAAGPREVHGLDLASLTGVPGPVLTAGCGIALLGWMMRVPVSVKPGRWEWPRAGTALAGLALAGWICAAALGEPAGLNAVEAVKASASAVAGGGAGLAWASLLAGAGLLGAGAAARWRGGPEPGGRIPAPAKAVRFSGGVILGLAGALAGGCPAAHAVFGTAAMGFGSVVFVLAMGCGAGLMGLLEWKMLGRPGASPSLERGV